MAIRHISARNETPNTVRSSTVAQETFSERLLDAIGDESVHAFAQRSGVVDSTLRRYLAGSMPGVDKLLVLAEAANVTLDWLAAGRGPMRAVEGRPALPAEALAGGMVPVPLLDVRPSAGPGALVEHANGVGSEIIAFREDWLRRMGVSPRHARLMVCSGDSMHDTISDGDLMVVDVGVREIVDNGIYVLVYAGLVIVKRIQIFRDRSVVLKSDNPRYEPETVPAHDLPELIVEGRVRWAGGQI